MNNITLVSNDGHFKLSFLKSKNELENDYDYFEKFIKAVEALVRTSPRYDGYLAALHREDILRCAILGEMEGDKVKVHMHHGPIFTLFDIVEIVLRYHMKNENTFTTMSIASEVLTCHEDNIIQIVGLSETPHDAWHMRKIFVHAKSSFGDVDKFIRKYMDGLEKEHFFKIRHFCKLCEENEGNNDNGLFDTSKRLSFANKKGK
jgi:hypothetical protein